MQIIFKNYEVIIVIQNISNFIHLCFIKESVLQIITYPLSRGSDKL